MSKRLVLVLASITLIIGCSYILTGKIIQQNYFRTIARFNSQHGIQVRLVDYNRGLFVSYAKIEITAPADEAAKHHAIPLQQTLTHGPLIVVNSPSGPKLKLISSQIVTTLGDPWQQNFIDYTNNPKPLSLTTLVTFFNEATTWISLTAVDQTTPTKFNIAWSDLNGEITHDLNFVNYNGKIDWPSIKLSSPESAFSINDLTVKLTSSKQAQEYTNNNAIRIKNISYSKQQTPTVNLDDINFRLQLAVNTKQKMDMEFAANFADSQILQQKFAQNSLKIQLNNIEPRDVMNISASNLFSLKGSIDILQTLSNPADAKLNIELPKHFSEALISYLSYELYRSSTLGKYDKRINDDVQRDITASINKIIATALKNKIFIDQGAYYALNFDNKPNPA